MSKEPGSNSFRGKDSTSVARSILRNSRFTCRMPSSSVSITLIMQFTSTPSASRARLAACLMRRAALLWPRFFTSRLT